MPTETLRVVVDAEGIAQAIAQPRYLVRVVKGPDRKKERRSSGARFLIGSGEGAQLQLSDPTVSAVHCEILVDQRGVRVRDLESKNGVVVGSRRVGECYLESGDDLTLGGSVVRFSLLDEEERTELDDEGRFGRLRGRSLPMRQLYGELKKAAASDATVLLYGETGTGKELAAEALIAASGRKDKPVVVVDCAQLGLQLAESELFGHEAGAFTGATRQHIGAFERANGGTVFLDEVGELPKELQAKLLGVLERKCVQRVGGGTPIPIDVRVVAATRHELEREVNRNAFRSDLYFRLSAIQIRLPTLREHAEDIPDLISSFLEGLPNAAPLSPDQLRALYARQYPGNVRELRNLVERAALGLELSPPKLVALEVDVNEPYRAQKDRLLASFQRSYLTRMYELCKGNISELSRRSGLDRMHLYDLLRRNGLQERR